MRRLVSIAAFGLMLSVPLWAQRGGHGGGGHMGGGGMRGGGFVSRGGNFGGGHSFAGMRGGMGSGPRFTTGFNQSSNHGSWHGTHTSHNHNFHNHRFHRNCSGWDCSNWASWGSGWGYPSWGWGGGWGYDPSWWWGTWEDQDRRFDEDYYRQYEMARRWNEDSLAEQQMRRRQDEEDEEYARRSSRGAASDPVSQSVDSGPATVLVFRDQRKQEVQNYAIVGQTMWAFSAGKTQKIPLADLDVAATQRANDDRGVVFRVPGTKDGL